MNNQDDDYKILDSEQAYVDLSSLNREDLANILGSDGLCLVDKDLF